MKQPLHELVSELVDIQNAIEDAGGEISPEIETALARIDAALPVKVEGICKVMRSFELDEIASKQEIQRLTTRRAVAANAVARLKDYLKTSLEAIGEKSVRAGIFGVSVCKNSAPSVFMNDGVEIPDEFAKVETVTTISLDREKVLEAWKTDPASIPLCINVVQGSHIRIR